MSEETVVIKKKKGKGKFRSNPKYNEEDFKEKLSEYYNVYRSWDATAKKLNEEFETNISATHVKRIFHKDVGLGMIESPKASKEFQNNFDEIMKDFEKAKKLTSMLVNALERVQEALEEQGDLEKSIKLLKLTPQILSIHSALLKQIEFLRKDQEHIKIQQNNLILSPIQITQIMMKRLKEWRDDGYIRILKKMPEIEEEDDEEN